MSAIVSAGLGGEGSENEDQGAAAVEETGTGDQGAAAVSEEVKEEEVLDDAADDAGGDSADAGDGDANDQGDGA